MLRKMTLAALVGGTLAFSSGISLAQDLAVLDDLYGRGVHAYFSHDSHRAHDLLSQAIGNGSRDPRAYYFRGLALRSLGRPEDAKLDFQTGAQIEAGGEELRNLVSRSLERVQGPTRMELEGVRRLARLTTRSQRLEREERRYQQLQDAEREVLRSPAAARPAPRPAAPLPETARPDATDPFSEAPPAAIPAPRPATPAPTTPAPAPATPAPAEEDPFGEAPATPPAPRPMPAPAPAEEDPFGDAAPAPAPATPAPPPAPAEEDPFGEPAPAPAPPAEEKPAAPPPAADDEDPFAANPAPTRAAPAATTAAKPSGASSSLFRALGKAILADEDAKPASPTVSDENVRPASNVEEATDPFADDPEPAAAPAEAAKPTEAPANDPFAEDPFE